MSKLKKQFWYYGVIPILILYFFALHFWGQNLILGFNDCLPNRSCSDFFMSELERSKNLIGKCPYNVFNNNCEHVAYYCITGKKYSYWNEIRI